MKYALTPEHRAELKPWAEKWIANAMSCKPMDDADREAMKTAIAGMYNAAGLTPPQNIVFVPSPLVARVSAGFAAAIWYLQNNRVTEAAPWGATWVATETATRDATQTATRDATEGSTQASTRNETWDATCAATKAATRDATEAAIRGAMGAATRGATEAATRAATRAATEGATRAATWDATRGATWASTWVATEGATEAATLDATCIASLAQHIAPDHAEFLTQCASIAHVMGNPGNHSSGPAAFLSFFRHVAKLDLPVYDAWQHYESAAIYGSWRYMHPRFCIVSDRPELIRVDDQHRPHCETGPSHRWRDGCELYHWHGTRIPKEWITDPASLTAQVALTWTNIEQRRVACEILGWDNILRALDARTVNDSGDSEIGVLLEVDIPDIGRERFLRVRCGTGRQFALPVPPYMQTAMQANAWTYGLDEVDFFKPEVRT